MKKQLSPTSRLKIWFVAGTAVILLVALAIANALEYTFVHFDLISWGETPASGWYWVLIFGATSILIGLLLAFLLGRIIFKPINTIVHGMTKLSEGDFSTRIDLGKYDGMKKLTNSFNSLAQELEKTEILRSDFINDFSHELKTPIVSISGLISLMKSDNLSEEKKHEYLNVMEEEATRLTQMTSNALYLSKIETQGILTNKKSFNVSEQIRNSLLLLERKWSKKNLSPSLEFEEYTISANEDMLKQVWLNLIDNAIKFSEPEKELKITAEIMFEELFVSIENFGPEIPKSDYEAIFNKFYQCDKSRSTDGNGIGLSIVKHIINLHGGEIMVNSKNGKTVFTVSIPIK
jgi:signal transduction histidine kinase